jgi:hypothetical protein
LTLYHRAQSNGFTIWNAGKEGKRLYRSLSASARAAVVAFADVDARKLAQGMYDDMLGRRRIPILHFRCACAAAVRACVDIADKPGLPPHQRRQAAAAAVREAQPDWRWARQL